MPLLLELIVLMLVAYAAGVGLGWLAWGVALPGDANDDNDTGLEEGDSR